MFVLCIERKKKMQEEEGKEGEKKIIVSYLVIIGNDRTIYTNILCPTMTEKNENKLQLL